MSMPHLKRIEESADPIFNRGWALVLDHWTNRSLFLFSSDSHYFQRIFFLWEVAWMHGTFPEWDHCFLCVWKTVTGQRSGAPRLQPVTVNVCLFFNIPLQGPEDRWEMKAKAKVISLDFGVSARLGMRVSDSRHRTRMRVSLRASAACKWAPLTTNRTCAMPCFSHHSGMSRGKKGRGNIFLIMELFKFQYFQSMATHMITIANDGNEPQWTYTKNSQGFLHNFHAGR